MEMLIYRNGETYVVTVDLYQSFDDSNAICILKYHVTDMACDEPEILIALFSHELAALEKRIQMLIAKNLI